MHSVTLEWIQIAIGWGFVASVLAWLFLRYAYGIGDRDESD